MQLLSSLKGNSSSAKKSNWDFFLIGLALTYSNISTGNSLFLLVLSFINKDYKSCSAVGLFVLSSMHIIINSFTCSS
jgi:hypothetical protein